jgi:hypothetical protein
MDKLNNLIEKTCVNYKTQGYSIDPLTIIFIAGLLIDIIKIIMACYSKADYSLAVKKINNPSLFDKMILKRRIRKLAEENKLTINIEAMRESLLNIKMTEQEFNSLILEVETQGGLE